VNLGKKSALETIAIRAFLLDCFTSTHSQKTGRQVAPYPSAAVTMMQLFLAFLALYFAPAAAFGGKL
jgi:hypothetical protein